MISNIYILRVSLFYDKNKHICWFLESRIVLRE